MLDSSLFGHLASGTPVNAWTLTGAGGLIVEAIELGGIVRRITVPDGKGGSADVVLGLNTLGEYLSGHPYFGAITGRVAGRIQGAAFHHEGKTFPLSRNNGANHIHGGFHGFDKKLWTAAPLTRPDGAPSLELTAHSADGEEGYPGALEISVRYTVLPDNSFVIETEAVSTKPTPCSLTHHSYFNLAGEGTGTILDHTLQVYADRYVPVDDGLMPTGLTVNVEGTSENLRLETDMQTALSKLHLRHGALYRLCDSANSNTLVPAARLSHPRSGRALVVSTTNPYLQVYTAAALDGTLTGKSGAPYVPHSGVCLECQGYPDPWNTADQVSHVLEAGVPQRQTTVYAFSAAPHTSQRNTNAG